MICAGTAQAATMDFGLTGGMAVPTGDAGDVFKSGFMGGVYGDMWLAPTMALGADIIGNFHSTKDDITTNADLSIIQFGLHGKLAMATEGASFRPHVQVGAAAYNVNLKPDIGEDNSETKIGVNGGVGLMFNTSAPVSFGIGGAFHNIFTEDESTQLFNVGVLVSFSTIPR
jgi:hypothetical protein